jgi:hypothetical protein
MIFSVTTSIQKNDGARCWWDTPGGNDVSRLSQWIADCRTGRESVGQFVLRSYPLDELLQELFRYEVVR